MTRYNDLIDTNGYWLCQKATCVKFCRKPFMMTFPNFQLDETKVSCDVAEDGTAKWSQNQFATCSSCDSLRIMVYNFMNHLITMSNYIATFFIFFKTEI